MCAAEASSPPELAARLSPRPPCSPLFLPVDDDAGTGPSSCPVTGQVLKTLELKPNIGLAGAIDEWVNRNIEVQVKSAKQYLAQEGTYPAECIERALDNVHRISEEHPTSRYRVMNVGLVVLLVKLLKRQGKSVWGFLRTNAFMALYSLSRDEESKLKKY